MVDVVAEGVVELVDRGTNKGMASLVGNVLDEAEDGVAEVIDGEGAHGAAFQGLEVVAASDAFVDADMGTLLFLETGRVGDVIEDADVDAMAILVFYAG